VALVIGAWNFPINLTLAPAIAAIAAGNCVVIKPSEVTPTCEALLAQLVAKYLDPTAVRVVRGGVKETTALLELPWNHVFYTGNGVVGKVGYLSPLHHPPFLGQTRHHMLGGLASPGQLHDVRIFAFFFAATHNSDVH